MNIYVDEMPNTISDCPFSRCLTMQNRFICTLGDGCVQCNGVSLCPFLKVGRSNTKRMLVNDYQAAALTTANPDTPSDLRIVEGVMGLAGEAGECVDICKKVVFQGHELDREHLAKELGDVAWYLANSADAIGYSLEDIFRMNIKKLKTRYPNGFNTDNSVNRKPNDI